MKLKHRSTALAVACVGAAGLLTGCAGGSGSAQGPVTVTVTPTVTATAGSPPSAPLTAHSDDVGRAYDFGAIVSSSKVGSVTVLVLDRYTWKGLDDAKLAKQGIPVQPFKGPVPYENLNTKLTYRLPVADGARILYHHCVAADQPIQTKSVAPADLGHLADRENTVLVALDAQGRVTAADNIPGCPG